MEKIKKLTSENIKMDTRNEKEGLHIYIIKRYDDDSCESMSIHLDRNKCRELRNEINKRLF